MSNSHCCRAAAILILMIAGCGHSARSLALDQEGARKACAEFLDAWKAGKKPADLHPRITGSDHDWEAGRKLVSYELLSNEKSDGTNLHVPVRLTLQNTAGQESKVEATYTVGTSPTVTVFREDQ